MYRMPIQQVPDIRHTCARMLSLSVTGIPLLDPQCILHTVPFRL